MKRVNTSVRIALSLAIFSLNVLVAATGEVGPPTARWLVEGA